MRFMTKGHFILIARKSKMTWIKNKINELIYKKYIPVVYIEDVDEVTDEIEKALWLIKEDLDLPTEEVNIAIEGRRFRRGKTV